MPTPIEIKYHGRTLRQLKREGMVALYQMDGPCGYEVVVIRIRKGEEAFGKVYPERESYPAGEDWGTYGWTYRPDERDKAEKRFDSLLPKWGANVPNRHINDDLEASEGKDSGPGVSDRAFMDQS
jgi:hypothetical protein